MSIALKIEQLLGALSRLAALPEREYDEDGLPIPGQYDEEYPVVRDAILASGGPDFQQGIAISGHDPLTIEQAALKACLNVCLQLAYTTRWLSEP